MWRNVFALIAGLFGMQIINTSIQVGAILMFPPPRGFDANDLVQLQAFSASMPLTVKVTIVAGWCLGAFAGAGLAARIARSHQLWLAMILGAVMAIAGVYAALTRVIPDWMTVCGVFGPLLMAWIAYRLAIPPEPVPVDD